MVRGMCVEKTSWKAPDGIYIYSVPKDTVEIENRYVKFGYGDIYYRIPPYITETTTERKWYKGFLTGLITGMDFSKEALVYAN